MSDPCAAGRQLVRDDDVWGAPCPNEGTVRLVMEDAGDWLQLCPAHMLALESAGVVSDPTMN